MEKILLLLPERPQPPVIRYGTTIAVILVSFGCEYALAQLSGDVPLFIFFPAVFFAGLAFDRGSGILAALLATALAGWQMRDYLAFQSFSLGLFFLIGIGLAIASETFRKALEKAWLAEQGKSLLLDELSHRTKNNLTMVGSLLRLQSRRKPELERDFSDAANRVQVMADVHDFLRIKPGSHSVDMGRYLQELCQKLGDTLRGVRPIAVTVDATNHDVPADVAVPIGIIVNELVTNSLKYAFPHDQSGTISVKFHQNGEYIVTVEDNGVGCNTEPKGLGTTLVQLMANQLHGQVTTSDNNPGYRTILRIKR